MKLFQTNKSKKNNLLKINSVRKFHFDEITGFSKNSLIYFPLQIFFLLLAMSFIVIAVFYYRLPPEIPFFYSLPWGEEQLAKNYYILFIPGFTLTIFLINFIFVLIISKKDIFLAQIILWSTCFIAVLSLITLIRIIFILI